MANEPSSDPMAAPPPLANPELPLAAAEQEAQRALKARPSFSIRTRVSLGFLALFLLSLAISLASLVIIARVRNKLQFMESATSYTFEVQQARRFEKNYFLYGTNLSDALDHVRRAQDILAREKDNITPVVGDAQLETMLRHIRLYEQLLANLSTVEPLSPSVRGRSKNDVQIELREHGSQMVAVAEDLVAKERQAVSAMLLASQRIPLVFLALLLVLIVYLANFIGRQMLRPLNRLMDATRRVGDGDYSPILPTRRYRDEFTGLALAMNHMMRQIVHRQELVAQSHKLQAIGTLTAGVAHELNNPINNIMLTACTLLEDDGSTDDEERRKMSRDLVHEAERAQRIVRNLLDFARESEMRSELLHVDDLVEKTLRLVANQIKLARVKVVRALADNLPPVHGDAQQLTQVLVNIVLNALDSMQPGGILTLSTRQGLVRDFLSIELSDTGIGIPDHLLPIVFDPFYTTKPTGKGTGLGLSVSLGIVQRHGGEIRVRSQTGEGTTFTIVLPVAKVPATFSQPPERAAFDPLASIEPSSLPKPPATCTRS
jgi:two-component system, NtrC family, sensor kinase